MKGERCKIVRVYVNEDIQEKSEEVSELMEYTRYGGEKVMVIDYVIVECKLRKYHFPIIVKLEFN